MTPRTEVMVVAAVLSDPGTSSTPVVKQVAASVVRAVVGPVDRPPVERPPVNADYTDTLATGHTESLNAWAERVLGAA